MRGEEGTEEFGAVGARTMLVVVIAAGWRSASGDLIASGFRGTMRDSAVSFPGKR